jgi:uncharacterized low-complexity protein
MGSRSHRFVRITVLAVALAAVSFAFAVMAKSPDIASAQDTERCGDGKCAGHRHRDDSNFCGDWHCLTKEPLIDSIDPEPRENTWTKWTTEPHSQPDLDPSNYRQDRGRGCTDAQTTAHKSDPLYEPDGVDEILACGEGEPPLPPPPEEPTEEPTEETTEEPTEEPQGNRVLIDFLEIC